MYSLTRCHWAAGSEIEREYHDTEWGVPIRDSRALFEMLTLEGAQAGLSWMTILNKREGYRRVFHGFDARRVSQMTNNEVEAALADPAIVRHRGKIESTVNNARQIVRMDAAGDSLSDFLWGFVDGRPVDHQFAEPGQLPAKTDVSTAMSKALKAQGFRFVGPTTCYSLMQAAGMVNDHLLSCFRHAQVQKIDADVEHSAKL